LQSHFFHHLGLEKKTSSDVICSGDNTISIHGSWVCMGDESVVVTAFDAIGLLIYNHHALKRKGEKNASFYFKFEDNN
jgi:hypothetical protein